MMTLEEAIKHCKDVALSCTNKECALEHFQLLKWLQEYSNVLEKQSEQKSTDKIQIGKKYKCIASPRYTTFMIGQVYKPNDKFLCSLMNLCSDCFEPFDVTKPQGKTALEAAKEEKVDNANKIESKDYSSIDPHFFKTTDKVEPKFHEGEWITNGDYTWKIVEVKPLDYILQSQESNIVDDTISHVDEQFHSFTIKDAKDGDVLYFNDNTIVIFKDLYNATTFHSYCHIKDGVFDISKDNMPDWWESGGFHPATKEQCELLFSKMKEAGYEWDAEKKELKEIEQNSDEWSEEDEGYYDAIIAKLEATREDALLTDNEMNFLKSLEKRVFPKSNWNEEDERTYKSVLYAFEHNYPLNSEQQKFLKSLKERVQPKQEWSEEDNLMIDETLYFVQEFKRSDRCKNESDLQNAVTCEHFLKSLKERYTWKPSNEHYELEEFAKIVRGNLTGISKAVQELFEAKYLQLTGNKMYGGFKD